MNIFFSSIPFISACFVVFLILFVLARGTDKNTKLIFVFFAILELVKQFAFLNLVKFSIASADFLMWEKIGLIAAAALPAVRFHFFSIILSRKKLIIPLTIIYAAVLGLILFFAAGLFLFNSTEMISFSMIFSVILEGGVFLAVLRHLRFSQIPLFGKRLKIFFLGLVLGFFGAMAGVLYHNSMFIVVGGLLDIISLIILASFAVRYPPIELRRIIFQLANFSVLLMITILPLFVLISYEISWMANQKNSVLAVVFLVVFYVFIVYLHLVQPIVNRIFGQRRLRIQKTVRDFFMSISNLSSLFDLIARTEILFNQVFHFQKITLYLVNEKKQKFFPAENFIDAPDKKKKEFSLIPDRDFWERWKEDSRILTIRDASSFENTRAGGAFSRAIKSLDADVLFPLVFAGNFLGFFALKTDPLRQGLRVGSLRLLDEIRDELSIAFSNALLYHKTFAWNESLEEKIKQRTKELQLLNEKIYAERSAAKMFSRMVVRREIEMIELKRKIKELRPV